MGMRKGDTIVRMDESLVRTAGDIGRAFDQHAAGTPMVFEVDRKGQRLTVQGIFPPTPKPPHQEEAFRHSKRSGRVSVVRHGNRFETRTRGIGAFTLLLSPGMIDFDQPVTVVVNSQTAFEGPVKRSVTTLLRYAAHDNDRTMLFGAELPILVP
jgi:membrane-associated protease RseP (regulator of RpoE activity)